jgi:thioesterase domain-containing protein
MLAPVQRSGRNPPLFIVHGRFGIMPLGHYLAKELGSDQPLYIVNANGIDGQQAVTEGMSDMLQIYVAEVMSARPTGPLIVAGVCTGALIAIEIVRELQAKTQRVVPLILIDPPPMPPGYREKKHTIDPRQPQIAAQLYEHTRTSLLDHASLPYNDMPFDHKDPEKLHSATLAGLSSLIAIAKHIPTPFSGAAELVLSTQRAPGFFHPGALWREILPGPQAVHVLPWNHVEMFRSGRNELARLLSFILQGSARSDTVPENRMAERRIAGAGVG